MSFGDVFKHLHIVLLLTLLWLSFGKLVEDPPAYLLSSFPVLAALQITHATLCLDATHGASSKKKNPSGTSAKAGAKQKGGESIVGTKILPAFLALTLASTAGTMILYGCMVLMGAPLTTHVQHTVYTAAHMSLLAGFPLIYTHQVDANRWREIIALQLPLDEVYGGALGTLLGAWFGAVPIPLDWDRDWQKWPVTILTGVYVGYAVGRLAGIVLHGRKIAF